MINILCFGDSNTFGTNPKGGRHSWNVRWPGRLQVLLGPDYYVIEEGLGGRTTIWEDPLEPNRCGIKALPIALLSHKPLDMVILSLGTNDCKAFFNASPRVIAAGMAVSYTHLERAPCLVQAPWHSPPPSPYRSSAPSGGCRQE